MESIFEQLPDFKKLRKDKGLSLRQVEEITGISNAYLSQLETGKIKSPSFDTVIKLLKVYIKPIVVEFNDIFKPNNNNEMFKPFIWHTSPACKNTFEELVKVINQLIDRIEKLENKNRKY